MGVKQGFACNASSKSSVSLTDVSASATHNSMSQRRVIPKTTKKRKKTQK